MADIKTPEKYVGKEGIIKEAGSYIARYGKKALIVGSKTARQVAEQDLVQSLEEQGIRYEVQEFSGYPSIARAEVYAARAKEIGAEVLIALGGGKVMDVVKVAGSLSDIPVVTIPTIAATCASWAAVSIIYTEEGDFEQFYNNRYTPRLILVDYAVIAKAPERYIKAGIVDTYAKWFELAPAITGEEDELVDQLSYFGSKLAYEILDENTEKALEAVRSGQVTKEVTKVIDAIIFLTGYVGSFVGNKAFAGFAHPFYHSSRRIAASRKSLHGELVSYGILTQLVLENKPEETIGETIQKFASFDEAFTLEDLGLADNPQEDLAVIANRTFDEFGSFTGLGIGEKVEDIIAALFKTDELVKKWRQK
ncbi:MAG: iron-containing alcohol dehydrogenase family protein [Eubacteriales bacterium]|nr:iron-containing alcohol dehydrogenase family protein [Eubacteriales bacterium]